MLLLLLLLLLLLQCRNKCGLFLAYCCSFGSIAGAVVVLLMLKQQGGDLMIGVVSAVGRERKETVMRIKFFLASWIKNAMPRPLHPPPFHTHTHTHTHAHKFTKANLQQLCCLIERGYCAYTWTRIAGCTMHVTLVS